MEQRYGRENQAAGGRLEDRGLNGPAFGVNLQQLRQKQSMSQEGLAEKLGVSRQSVSKWESGAAYPEMPTLIGLCDLFDVDLDTMLRGDVAAHMAADEVGYDRLMDHNARLVSLGVGLILLGVGVINLWEGVWEHFHWHQDLEAVGTALLLLFVLVAVVLFIVAGVRLENFRKRNPRVQPFYSQSQQDAFARRFVWWVAIPVAMLLADMTLLVVLSSPAERMGPLWENGLLAVFLWIIGGAVSALVWAGLQKEKFDVSKYNLENLPEFKRKDELIGTICAVIMMGATILYLILAVPQNRWGEVYWPFPVGGILCGISALIVNFIYGRQMQALKEQEEKAVRATEE